ncbi:MAG: methionyl-tRNA formyltransferase [Desulfobacteraceae bacterium]|nr:methionyl-tRNA formyltransferase [Desulfobacteraceae bacterium]
MEKEAQRGEGIDLPLPGIIFLGTPDFAVPSLRKLIEAGAPVRLVVTQPDRPSGRGRKISSPAVKILAEETGIPVYQPERVRGPEVLERIRSRNAACAVVVAFGQILPQSFLDLFALGTLNVHGSLLPQYRGAAPIQRAILDGRERTGVSIMLLDAGMDTGPVLSQQEVRIDPRENFRSVHDRLSEVGADLLLRTLREWAAGSIAPRNQDDGLATYAPPLEKKEMRIDWHLPAKNIINTIRAFDPVPGAYFHLSGKRVKCFSAAPFPWTGTGEPGQVAGVSESGLIITCGDRQAISIGEVHMEGQRRMCAGEFACGRSIPAGTLLE